MRKIDILTTQNVTISYQLASLSERIFAFILDILALGFIGAILIFVVLQFFPITSDTFYYLFFFCFTSFFSLISEILMNGQSIGKKLIGIKVMKLEGLSPALNDYLIRWALRPLEIWMTAGAVASLLISSSQKGQRIGDVIANTTVIKTTPEERILLNDILSIKSLQTYQPIYPLIREFSENEMLLIKEVLDRYLTYKNQAHEEALNNTIEIICSRIEILEKPKDSILFIRTLIKDFVAMSR